MKKIFILLAGAALLAGCAPDQPPPAQFAAPPSKKIVLNVARIDIVDHSEFQPSDSPYYTDHFTPTIAQAARKWIETTLQAGGTSGEAILTIEDASLSAQALATSDALTDKWFKRQQASRYNGHVSVHMDLRAGKDYGYADAEATHYVTLPEQPGAAERQNAYANLLDNLLGDFSKNFDASIREHAPWAVIPSP